MSRTKLTKSSKALPRKKGVAGKRKVPHKVERKAILAKRKKTIQTRRPTPGVQASPFKVQVEHCRTFLQTTALSSSVTTPTAGRDNQVFLLTPRSAATKNERKLESGAGELTAANIVGSISNGTNSSLQARLMVIELFTEAKPITGGPITLANSTHLNDFFKDQRLTAEEFAHTNFGNTPFNRRIHAAINNGKFRILRTKILSLAAQNLGESKDVQGFHFYVPIARKVASDTTVQLNEYIGFDSESVADTGVNRYSVVKPIVLAMELIIPAGRELAASKGLTVNWTTKYAFKDN